MGRFGESNDFCGGKGGKPGPCPTGGAGDLPGGASKQLAAEKQKFVGKTVGAPEQAHAKAVAADLASSLGGKTEDQTTDPGQKDKKPYDVQIPKASGAGNHDVEVKTLLKGEKQGISVHEDALLRKVNHAKANPENTFHTVVKDERATFGGGEFSANYSGHDLYYKRGSGRYTLAEMHKVKDVGELKALMDMDSKQLPQEARGQLPPPPPTAQLKQAAAKASEARKARDGKRKERNKDKLREQARARASA